MVTAMMLPVFKQDACNRQWMENKRKKTEK